MSVCDMRRAVRTQRKAGEEEEKQRGREVANSEIKELSRD